MVYGIGTDIVELSRVQATYQRFGMRFVDRLLMDEERVLFEKNKAPARFLAMRFAAKEATVKAMGTGFAHGVWIRDVGIVSSNWGRPEIIWSERGRAYSGICRSHALRTNITITLRKLPNALFFL